MRTVVLRERRDKKRYGKKTEATVAQVRLDKLYDEIEEIETLIEEAEARLYNIRQEKISANITDNASVTDYANFSRA